jgi:hypothetical protein
MERELTNGQKLDLERMIDLQSLQAVLEALVEIADAKAQHIRENWPGTNSEPLARAWDHVARRIIQAVNQAKEGGV